MIRRVAPACVVIALAVAVVRADPSADAERAFRAAQQRAAAGADGVAAAIPALEALGRQRPLTRWSDDAWVEAARLAERTGEFDRARAALTEAIAIGTDEQLVRRAKNDLERLTAMTGAGGEWTRVAAEHERLVSKAAGGGDPKAALEALEALARANPAYPRGVGLRLTLAKVWEEEADRARAIRWLRDAVKIAAPADRERARIALVRALIRDGSLDDARTEIDRIDNRATRAGLERDLETARTRTRVRWSVAAVLVLLAGFAAFVLRRRSESWRAALRRLAQPPAEVIYFIPIGLVVGAISTTGNPLVSRAVIAIVIAGAVICWISGVLLEAARARGPLGARRALVHAACVALAVAAMVYVVIDRVGLIDLVAETWRAGPAR